MPDYGLAIKELCTKAAALALRARETGWTAENASYKLMEEVGEFGEAINASKGKLHKGDKKFGTPAEEGADIIIEVFDNLAQLYNLNDPAILVGHVTLAMERGLKKWEGQIAQVEQALRKCEDQIALDEQAMVEELDQKHPAR